MIRSFKDAEAEKIITPQRSRGLPPDIQQVALRKLRMLNRPQTLQDRRVPPANPLEPLSGDRSGQYSIRISVQGKRSITPDTALRLAHYFDMSPQFWLGLQMDYDLDVAQDALGERLSRELAVYA